MPPGFPGAVGVLIVCVLPWFVANNVLFAVHKVTFAFTQPGAGGAPQFRLPSGFTPIAIKPGGHCIRTSVSQIGAPFLMPVMNSPGGHCMPPPSAKSPAIRLDGKHVVVPLE